MKFKKSSFKRSIRCISVWTSCDFGHIVRGVVKLSALRWGCSKACSVELILTIRFQRLFIFHLSHPVNSSSTVKEKLRSCQDCAYRWHCDLNMRPLQHWGTGRALTCAHFLPLLSLLSLHPRPEHCTGFSGSELSCACLLSLYFLLSNSTETKFQRIMSSSSGLANIERFHNLAFLYNSLSSFSVHVWLKRKTYRDRIFPVT